MCPETGSVKVQLRVLRVGCGRSERHIETATPTCSYRGVAIVCFGEKRIWKAARCRRVKDNIGQGYGARHIVYYCYRKWWAGRVDVREPKLTFGARTVSGETTASSNAYAVVLKLPNDALIASTCEILNPL